MTYLNKIINFYKAHKQLILSFAYGFFVILIFMLIISHRGNSARKIINQYNQFKISMAKIGYIIDEKSIEHFIFTRKDIHIDINDLTIKSDANKINIEKVRIYAPKFNRKSIKIKTVGNININNYQTKLQRIVSNIWLLDNGKIEKFNINIEGYNNSSLCFAIKKSTQYMTNPKSKFIDFEIAIKKLKMKQIILDKIKVSGDIKGNFINKSNEPNFNLWLENDGSIGIDKLFIENSDFSLIAEGKMNFTKNKKLNFNFNTASYGLIELIDQLENKNLLKREKSTIAKIVLSNKKSDNKKFITASIRLKDDKLYIDQIELINFKH